MDLSPARGTRDLLPATVAVRDHVLATITEVYRRYGYQRIETPALENIERLQGGQGGENVELIEATTEALAATGLSGTTVRVSDRRFLSALAASVSLPPESWDSVFITLDKLDKIGWDGVRAELSGRGLDAGQIDRLAGTITGLTGVTSADQLADALPNLPDDVLADLTTTLTGLGDLAEERDLKWEFDPT